MEQTKDGVRQNVINFVAQFSASNFNDALRFTADLIKELAWIITYRRGSSRREYWDAFYKLRSAIQEFEQTLVKDK